MQLEPKLILDYAEQLSFQEHFVLKRDESLSLTSLILAICRVESNLNPDAVRYESGFHWLVDGQRINKLKPATCSYQTEINLQKISWGLMQIMGATARNLGCGGWLTGLLDPVQGLYWGMRYLQWQYRRFFVNDGLHGVIAAYNAGSPRYKDGRFVNQAYVDKVLSAMKGV